jgi:hypothetical protein
MNSVDIYVQSSAADFVFNWTSLKKRFLIKETKNREITIFLSGNCDGFISFVACGMD